MEINVEDWGTSSGGISGDQSGEIRRTRASHVVKRSTTVDGVIRIKRRRNGEWESLAVKSAGTYGEISPEIVEEVILVIWYCWVWFSFSFCWRWDPLWASVCSSVCYFEDRWITVRSLDLFCSTTVLCVTKCASVITPTTNKNNKLVN